MWKTMLRSIAATGLFATPLLAHDGARFSLPRFLPPNPFVRVEPIRFGIDFGARRPIHLHREFARRERVWVAPVYATRVVGYDLCRRPILAQVLVCAGHFEERIVRTCECGAVLGR